MPLTKPGTWSLTSVPTTSDRVFWLKLPTRAFPPPLGFPPYHFLPYADSDGPSACLHSHSPLDCSPAPCHLTVSTGWARSAVLLVRIKLASGLAAAGSEPHKVSSAAPHLLPAPSMLPRDPRERVEPGAGAPESVGVGGSHTACQGPPHHVLIHPHPLLFYT